MKEQTFISYLEDENGKMIDFERWTYKKVETVLKSVKELYKHPIYSGNLKRSKNLSIYATPEGCSKGKYLVLKMPITEILV